MKVIVCKFVPRDFVVNIFGTLWTRDKSWIGKYVINHERIHSAQQRELLWIPFYILYFLEWLWLLIRYRDSFKAYKMISFEREAYAHDRNLQYLKGRHRYAQWKK